MSYDEIQYYFLNVYTNDNDLQIDMKWNKIMYCIKKKKKKDTTQYADIGKHSFTVPIMYVETENVQHVQSDCR